MPSIAKITLPNGVQYDLEDSYIREQFNSFIPTVGKGVIFRGQTSTELRDGSAINPINLVGVSTPFTAHNGDLVIYKSSGTGKNAPQEFIFQETNESTGEGVWREFGSTGSLNDLAFKDKVTSEPFTPSGKIYVNGVASNEAVISGTPVQLSTTIVPNGYNTAPEFQGRTTTLSLQGTINGDMTINYTPSGTISTPSFAGVTKTLVVGVVDGESSYTPSGTVSTPTVTVIPTSTTIHQFKTAGTLPTFSMNVADQILSFNWDAGTLPTYEDKNVVTGIQSVEVTQPTFTGNSVRLATTYKPEGQISRPAFSGSATVLQAALDNGQGTMTGSYTPQGTVTTPAFVGQQTQVSIPYTPSFAIGEITFVGYTNPGIDSR